MFSSHITIKQSPSKSPPDILCCSGRYPLAGNTTTFIKSLNFSNLASLSPTQFRSLISPGWLQGFLVTTTRPSIVYFGNLEAVPSIYSYSAFFSPWSWQNSSVISSIAKLYRWILTKISPSLRRPWSSMIPISTAESLIFMRAFFFKFTELPSTMLSNIASNMGSFSSLKGAILLY